jgi:ATP-dependent Clp protease ATP-binding subunit ClpA
MGARPLSRKIDELIRVPLSKRILFQRLKDATVTARLDGDKIEFDVVREIEFHVTPTPAIEVQG